MERHPFQFRESVQNIDSGKIIITKIQMSTSLLKLSNIFNSVHYSELQCNATAVKVKRNIAF